MSNYVDVEDLKIERKKFTPAPEGLYDAVCLDCWNLGPVSTMFGIKDQLRFAWEIDHLRENGKRFVVNKSYTKSLSQKSTLYRDLLKWSGELPANLNVSDFVGKPCRLVIVHRTGKDGSIFANISGILKPGENKLNASGEYVRMKDRTIEKIVSADPILQ